MTGDQKIADGAAADRRYGREHEHPEQVEPLPARREGTAHGEYEDAREIQSASERQRQPKRPAWQAMIARNITDAGCQPASGVRRRATRSPRRSRPCRG